MRSFDPPPPDPLRPGPFQPRSRSVLARPTFAARFILLLSVPLLSLACEESGPTAPDEVVARVDVSFSGGPLTIGDTLRLTATARNARGGLLTGKSVVWTADSPARVDLSPEGSSVLLRPLSEGTVRITARVDGVHGEASFDIQQGQVDRVELPADSLTLVEGQTMSLHAVARDRYGNVVTGRFVRWTSSEPDVAQISPVGAVTGVRPGWTVITARVDGRSASTTVRVETDFAYDLLFWSPTGGGGGSVFRLDLRIPGTPETPLLPGTVLTQGVAPSPDGNQIAFLGNASGGGWGVYRQTLGSEDPVLLDPMTKERTLFCGHLAWSPDGRRLAYTCHVTGMDSQIVTIDASDGGGRRVVGEGETGHRSFPSWSPPLPGGGYRIAFAWAITDEQSQIWTMAEDGSDWRRVTSGAWDEQPAWSPDGTTIAFLRTTLFRQSDLFLVGSEGGEARSLLPSSLAGVQLRPTWSPDGELIAFSSRHEDRTLGSPFQIYTASTDGTRIARRTSGATQKHWPAWILR